jgi:ribonuclease J
VARNGQCRLGRQASTTVNVCIHRGAEEIGGTCIEVEAEGARVVLDVGQPLYAGSTAAPLPDVPGFLSPDPSLLGLLISHGHQDHWGLVGQLQSGIPVYIGEAACRILKEAAFFSSGVALDPAGFLRHREPFVLGPFTITPFLNDHSAFDTYSLLIDAGGRRLFYSADFQAHGRKADMFAEFVRKPPTVVDVILIEGTNLQSEGSPKSGPTEQEVEKDLIQTFKTTSGTVLAMYSAQNIDRLVTMFRACVQAGRHLVLDLYAASIAAATGNPNIPKAGFDQLLVYVPLRQRVQVKESREFERVSEIRPVRIYPEDLAERSSRLVLTFRPSMIREIEHAGCLNGAVAVWSMWPGYLERPGQERLLKFLETSRIPLVTHHASGHAYLPDLQRLARALKPTRLVPIHSFAPGRFSEFFENVELHANGEWWAV